MYCIFGLSMRDVSIYIMILAAVDVNATLFNQNVTAQNFLVSCDLSHRLVDKV